MNDSKVYYVSEDMEDQYLTEDSKIRLYLSPVRYGNPQKRKETVMEKVAAFLLAFAYSIFITYVTGQWLVSSVTRWRGYDAIGGEYILVIVIFMACFGIMLKLLKSYRG